jgi:hypothetical protein
MIASARIWRWAALALCAVIAAIVFGAPDPNARLRSALAIHDFGHVLAFGLVTVLVAFALSSRSRPTFLGRTGMACLAAIAAVALGGAVELAQVASGSNGDPWDVVRDSGGAFSVALLLTARDPAMSAPARVALACAAVFALAAFAYPIWVTLVDEARGREQFPVLATFETEGELSRFQFGEGTKPRVVTTLDDEARLVSAIQLQLPPGKYPGFALSYFPRDWRGMRALSLMIVNPEPTPIEMTVRIDDAEYDYRLDLADRYNRAFSLPPGPNRIEIPLSDVATAPRGRRFDLGRVRLLLVYSVDLKQTREIIIGPITLLH